MKHELPALPYPKNGLEPSISSETLEYHYGKHHAAYVTNINNLIKGTKFENLALEDIIKKSSRGIFKNAAQVWNHSFYWNCLKPGARGQPQEEVSNAIRSAFGLFANFKNEFTQKAVSLFGSGWAWLVQNKDDPIAIVQTSNSGTLMAEGNKAILTLDVWEHAYYIDYRNARPKYVEAFWNIVNWGFAVENFQG